MNIRISPLLLILVFSFTTVFARTFVHPGLSHKLSDLERMKIMIQNNREPWKTSFQNLQASNYAQSNYSANWSQSNTVLQEGTTNYNNFKYDALACYYNALEWYITGEEAYALKSVEILNSMKNIKSIVSATQSLAAGRVLPKLLEAAEIIKNTYSGWSQSDIDAFKAMLVYPEYSTSVDHSVDAEHSFYWAMYNGDYGRHGNQGLFGMLGTLQIAVFCDNEIMYDRVLRYLQGQSHRDDDLSYVSGPTKVSTTFTPNDYVDTYTLSSPYILTTTPDYGYNEVIENYIWENGQVQEASRDQGHSQLGLGLINNICEVAWNQGDDLYGTLNNRLLLGWEYFFHYNLSFTNSFPDQASSWEPTFESGEFIQRRDRSQRWFSKQINPHFESDFTSWSRGSMFNNPAYTTSTGTKTPMYEMALGHFKSRLGLTPSSYKWLSRADSVSRHDFGYERQGFEVDYLGFGGLSFHRVDSCAGDPVTFTSRQPSFEFHKLSDYSSLQAEDFDYMPNDAQNRAYYDLSGTRIYNAYRNDSLVTVSPIIAGGYKVADLKSGEWLNYTVDVNASALYKIKVNYTSPSGGGKLNVVFAGQTETGEIDLPSTGSGVWSEFTIANSVSLTQGAQSMRLFVTGTDNSIELDSIIIQSSSVRSIATGNWNEGTTWNTGVVPTSTDDVVLSDGFNVTLTESVSCNSLTASGTSNIIGTYSTGTSLTTTGDVTINGTFSSAFQIIIGGSLTVSEGAVWNLQSSNSQLLTTNGAVNIAGTLRGNTTAGGPFCGWQIQGTSPTLTISGTLGAGVIGGTGESVRLFLGHTGTATITGSGIINIASLMTASGNTSNQETVIDADMNLNSTETTTPTFTLQNGSHSASSKSLTINTGKTITLTKSGGYFHNYSATSPNNNGGNITYNIEGTLDVSAGRFYLTTNQQTSTQQVYVYVKDGGVLKTGTYLNLLQYSANQKAGIIVENGGLVDNSAYELSIASCSNLGNNGDLSYISMNGSNAFYKQAIASSTTTQLWLGTSAGYSPISLTPASGVVITAGVLNSFITAPNDISKANDTQWSLMTESNTTSSLDFMPSTVTNTNNPVCGINNGSSWTESLANYNGTSFNTIIDISFTSNSIKYFSTGSQTAFSSSLTTFIPDGDYYSRLNGDICVASSWMVSNGNGGGTVATVVPGTSTNVWIVDGMNMTQSAIFTCKDMNVLNGSLLSGQTLNLGSSSVEGNLKIYSNGILRSSNATGGTVNTLNVYGTQILVDGQLGAASATNHSAYNTTSNTEGGGGFRVYCQQAGGTTTISGTGKLNVARLYGTTSTSSGKAQVIDIDMDVNLLNNHTSQIAALSMFGNAGGSDRTLNIKSNRTVRFTGETTLSKLHRDAESNGGYSTGNINYNVYGTLDMSKCTILLATSSTSGNTKSTFLNIKDGGTLSIGDNVKFWLGQASGQTCAIVAESGSTVKFGATNSNSTVISLNLGAGPGIMPSSFTNLILDNRYGLAYSTPFSVTGSLTLTDGIMDNSTNTLTLAAGATIEKDGGSLSAVPIFGDNVKLTYTGSSVKGNEFPSNDIINTLTVNNSGGISLSDNRSIPNISIGSGSQLTVDAGIQLTIETTLTNNGTLTLNSNAANGTATIITPSTINGSGTANVNQYLADARNWYVSSPVASMALPSSGYTLYAYDEAGSKTSDPSGPYWFTPTGNFIPGVGYIALPGVSGSTITFSGTLNSGNINVDLTNTGAVKTGYNLIGNPYPCHLTWTDAFYTANSSLIEPTIWYRTNSGTVNASGQWSFVTYGAVSGETVGATDGSKIPPMQAFWVKAKQAGILTLNSDLTRSHQVSNPLRAPSASDRKRLRLEVSNSEKSDETLIFFDQAAKDEFDSYDSHKMFNNSLSIPEIYTSAGTEKLVINGLNSYNIGTVIPLGFKTMSSNIFTIKAIQIENFESDTKIVLHDNVTGSDVDLVDGENYSFQSGITDSDTRFSIVFKSISQITDLSDSMLSLHVWCQNGKIGLNYSGILTKNAYVKVYNAQGVQVYQENVNVNNQVLRGRFNPGVYLIRFSNGNILTSTKIFL